MKKILYIIIISLIVTNCSFKPVVKHHGTPFLEKKQKSLVVNEANKNDIIKILGNPSTQSKFDNDVWIYIERQKTQSKFKNLGQMKIYKNDVLVLEIDNYGILKKKEFYNIDDMKKIDVVKATTQGGFKKKSFVYNFLSS
jgi:outer membrane protein assembly factor BamE (lipoprotein component of BamABCDE complex)